MENPAIPDQPEQYYRNLIHKMHQGYVRLQVIFRRTAAAASTLLRGS